MKESLFYSISQSINDFNGLSRDCAEFLKKEYPSVSENTLYSIVGEFVITNVKRSWRKLHQWSYVDMYEEIKSCESSSGVLLDIANRVGLPPALIAKEILEETYCSVSEKGSEGTKNLIRNYMRDTTLIPDCNLAYEVFLCILYDIKYGSISECFSLCSGVEYEEKLRNYLTERKIAFYDENQLRERGYDKTPDFKLEVPIAVDGFIVNWIESKARFGTASVHNESVEKQYLSYWNRFGPGLVIYWFDFIDTLQRDSEKRFIIMNHFPENITYLDISSLS